MLKTGLYLFVDFQGQGQGDSNEDEDDYPHADQDQGLGDLLGEETDNNLHLKGEQGSELVPT